ncbi:hypothetical protein FOZ60_007108 [Perkinsus olseni]|uniref:Uncharacterized protein n=1 Tax=Perkinsus olseni TaxID=32597 RepID=A0A7J6NNA0_PEROL|nr:hypothetical protein FOZ60_007108 [Perkinsus olseni]
MATHECEVTVCDTIGLLDRPCRDNIISLTKDRILFTSGIHVVLYDPEGRRPIAVTQPRPMDNSLSQNGKTRGEASQQGTTISTMDSDGGERFLSERTPTAAVEITALAAHRKSEVAFLALFLPIPGQSRIEILSTKHDTLTTIAVTNLTGSKRIVEASFTDDGQHVLLAAEGPGSGALLCWRWSIASVRVDDDDDGEQIKLAGATTSRGVVGSHAVENKVTGLEVCPRSFKNGAGEVNFYAMLAGENYVRLWEVAVQSGVSLSRSMEKTKNGGAVEIRPLEGMLPTKFERDTFFTDCCWVSVTRHKIRTPIAVALTAEGILLAFDLDRNLAAQPVDCRTALDSCSSSTQDSSKKPKDVSFTTIVSAGSPGSFLVGGSSGCVMIFTTVDLSPESMDDTKIPRKSAGVSSLSTTAWTSLQSGSSSTLRGSSAQLRPSTDALVSLQCSAVYWIPGYRHTLVSATTAPSVRCKYYHGAAVAVSGDGEGTTETEATDWSSKRILGRLGLKPPLSVQESIDDESEDSEGSTQGEDSTERDTNTSSQLSVVNSSKVQFHSILVMTLKPAGESLLNDDEDEEVSGRGQCQLVTRVEKVERICAIQIAGTVCTILSLANIFRLDFIFYHYN